MSSTSINRVVARLSRRRYGVIYLRELHEHLTPSELRTCVRCDLIARRAREVFVNPAIPSSAEQDLAVAIGAAGAAWGELAAGGHRSACAHWSLLDDFPVVPEIVMPRERRIFTRSAVIRRSSDFDASLVVMHRRLLVTNPIVSVFLLAAVEGPNVVAEAIVRASRQRRFRPKAIERMMPSRARPGRDGIVCLRAALQSLPVGERPPDSVIELWFWRLARDFGLPTLAFQLPVQVAGNRFFVDFGRADLKLAIEIDDYETHGTLCGFVHDRERRNLLVLDGWTVLQFTWRQLRDEPEKVAAQVLEAFRRLGLAA